MRYNLRCLPFGGVSEWFMEMVLKTIDRKVRGFESLPLRRKCLVNAVVLDGETAESLSLMETLA